MLLSISAQMMMMACVMLFSLALSSSFFPAHFYLRKTREKHLAPAVGISKENLEFSQQWSYIKELLEEIYPLANLTFHSPIHFKENAI